MMKEIFPLFTTYMMIIYEKVFLISITTSFSISLYINHVISIDYKLRLLMTVLARKLRSWLHNFQKVVFCF